MRVSLKISEHQSLLTNYTITEDLDNGKFIISEKILNETKIIGKCTTFDKAMNICYLLSEIEIEEILNE